MMQIAEFSLLLNRINSNNFKGLNLHLKNNYRWLFFLFFESKRGKLLTTNTFKMNEQIQYNINIQTNSWQIMSEIQYLLFGVWWRKIWISTRQWPEEVEQILSSANSKQQTANLFGLCEHYKNSYQNTMGVVAGVDNFRG